MLNAQTVGIGLRAPHYADVLESRPPVDFLEVHSENFFFVGGASMRVLERAREHYPLNLHGVGLALASADTDSAEHLEKLAALVARTEPAWVSEHLCWGAAGGVHFNDLLPFPYTREALRLVAARVACVQERLGRRILIENLSAYVSFRDSEMTEFDFLAELSKISGCGILLDVNNLYVNACNFDYDPLSELAKLPANAVGEIHLAGHTRDAACLVDTHSSRVADEVWTLYERALKRVGAKPSLIEWDADIPALSVLLEEAARARTVQLGVNADHD